MGLPSRKGELANRAVAIGCKATPMRIFSTISASSSKSMLVCTRHSLSRSDHKLECQHADTCMSALNALFMNHKLSHTTQSSGCFCFVLLHLEVDLEQ